MKKIILIAIFLLIPAAVTSGCSSDKTGVSTEAGYYGSAAFPDKPAAPTNLRAEADQNQIVLAWDMAAWEDRYPFDIYRWTTGLQPKLLDSVPAGVHNYTDITATSGHFYYYLVVTRKDGAETSVATAQIAGIVLEPPSSTKPPIWARSGITPPKYDYGDDPVAQVAWSERKAQEIRDKLPWVFVDEVCPECNGRGIIALAQTNARGLPDLAYCPGCKGTGNVTNVYPKS